MLKFKIKKKTLHKSMHNKLYYASFHYLSFFNEIFINIDINSNILHLNDFFLIFYIRALNSLDFNEAYKVKKTAQLHFSATLASTTQAISI